MLRRRVGAMGLHICAVDIEDGKLAHAMRLGTNAVVNARLDDPVGEVRKATDRCSLLSHWCRLNGRCASPATRCVSPHGPP
jgi:D-arabinose 1-dehydrogenase-like Zn-dependent alcohol dehydrogenase